MKKIITNLNFDGRELVPFIDRTNLRRHLVFQLTIWLENYSDINVILSTSIGPLSTLLYSFLNVLVDSWFSSGIFSWFPNVLVMSLFSECARRFFIFRMCSSFLCLRMCSSFSTLLHSFLIVFPYSRHCSHQEVTNAGYLLWYVAKETINTEQMKGRGFRS